MVGCRELRLFAVAIAVVFAAVAAPCVPGQGLENVLRARARVFPAIGPGVAAVKRDSSGRYFILAEPASTISIFDASGKRLDQFPNANSHGATIRYAVAIDVDSRGRLFVADRGDNSIKIFAPDGSLAAIIHVNAPTSVVALSDGQFAVTTLQSKRLVQIMDERGATVRTFGDPADQSDAATPAQPVMDRGRITGDSDGNIYFAFTSLPDPTLQRFDRFGYSAYGAVISADQFGPAAGRTGHEVDLGYTMSGLYGPMSVGAWTDLHSLTSVSVGNRARRGPGAGTPSSGASSSSSGSSSTFPSTSGSTSIDGNALSYNSDDPSGILDSSSPIFGGTGNPDFGVAFQQGFFMPGMFGMGFGNMFHDGMFRGEFHEGAGGAGPGLGGAHPELGPDGPSSASAGPGNFAGHFPDGHDGFHGRSGFGLYRAAATVRVALDDPSKRTSEKPVITAVGVDPATQEVWTAVSDMLVHFDKTGTRMDSYYPVISEGTSLKITSILVEPDRILIATDPWGIYEFPRPDRPSQSPAPQNSIIAQPLPAPTPSPAAH
jgi:hypothetical protein